MIESDKTRETKAATSDAGRMRQYLGAGMAGLADGREALLFPLTHQALVKQAAGAFHLKPELFLQVQGTTEFRFPGQTLLLPPGSVLLVPARVYHDERVVPLSSDDSAGSTEAAFSNVVVLANGGFLSCHLATEGSGGRPDIKHAERLFHEQSAHIARWLEEAVALDQAGAYSRQAARGLVLAALAATLACLEQDQAPGNCEPALVVRCRRIVHDGLGDPALAVATIAERLGCAPDYLSHLFARTVGQRLSVYIVNQRLDRAAELLRHGDLSVKELAWACGYLSSSYFIRSFRQCYGLSPGEYREQTTTVPKDLSGSVPHMLG